MARSRWEVADVVRDFGKVYLATAGSRSPTSHRRVMRDITSCRTAVLGGHVEACDGCGTRQVSYNSCRNRHCPKCQSKAKARWIEARMNELLPVEYFHLVFTVPQVIAEIGLQNKRCFYNLLFRATADTLKTIGRDPKHLGADIGFLAVLHSWGQTMTFHPHLHCIVPGGGFDPSGDGWIPCRKGFFLPVRVLSRYFRRRLIQDLEKSFRKGDLHFHGALAHLAGKEAFQQRMSKARITEWVVYSKRPFNGPEQVLRYLGRYTHRIAISNHRITDISDGFVTFKWRDYRNGNKSRLMKLRAEEFLRRFLVHVLPEGFTRIRHFGFLANRHRKDKIEQARQILGSPEVKTEPTEKQVELGSKASANSPASESDRPGSPCPKCGKGRMIRIETLPATTPQFWDSS